MSRIVLRSILLNQATIGPTSTLAAGISPSSGIVDLLPYVDFSWADELTFILTVTAVTGAPIAGTLTPSFMLGNPHVGDGANQTTNYQFSDPNYVALDTAQKSALIAEGEDWTGIAFNAAFPVTQQRTIRSFGAMVNLRLDASTLTSGAKFTVSGTLIQKGT